MISINSVLPSFVNRTRAEIVSAFGGSQVSSRSPPFTDPCQLPVSQANLLIELSGAFAFGGPGSCFVVHPTTSTAAIVVSRRYFIIYEVLTYLAGRRIPESAAGQ